MLWVFHVFSNPVRREKPAIVAPIPCDNNSSDEEEQPLDSNVVAYVDEDLTFPQQAPQDELCPAVPIAFAKSRALPSIIPPFNDDGNKG